MDKKLTGLPAKYLSTPGLVGALSVYFFVFLLSELILNDRAAVVLGSSSVVGNYSIGIIFTGFGYLAFALSRGVFAGDIPRRGVLGVTGILYPGSMLAALFFAPPSLFTAVTCICTLSMGYMGGFVHYHAAVALQGGSHTGRVVGVSYFLAVSLQYGVQYFAVTETALVCCVAAGTGLLFAVILRPPRDWLFENPLPYERIPTAARRELWLTVAIVAFITVLAGMFDGVLTGLHAAGRLNVAGWPRLLLGVGELSAGMLYDVRKRACMPPVALCATLFTALGIVFLYENPTAGMCIYYFWAGFYVVYFTVVFLDLAPRTSNPALWAGMGRISRSFVVGLTAAPSEWLLTAENSKTTITVQILTFAVILVLFWLKGDLIPAKPLGPEDTDNRQPPDGSDKKRTLADFAAKYQFTPRETEVMEKLLVSDQGIKELAAEINISGRVLYRYLNSLYEKTGTSSRIGLLLLFHGDKKPIEQDTQQ